MRKRVQLHTVSVRELARQPAVVLRRVQDGERLIVCSHRRPVATLQPLDGCVVQPFEGAEYDIHGSPLGDAQQEATKLPQIEQEILVYGQKRDRFSPWLIAPQWDRDQLRDAIDDLALRGLIRKIDVGWRLTGRGWILREALVGREDPAFPDGWRELLSPGMYRCLRSETAWRIEQLQLTDRERPGPPSRPPP